MTKSSNSSATHITTEHSTTLNRRYVHRPSSLVTPSDESSDATIASTPTITNSSQIQTEAFKRRQAIAEQMNRQNLANLNKHNPEAQSTPHKIPIISHVQVPEPPVSAPKVAAIEQPSTKKFSPAAYPTNVSLESLFPEDSISDLATSSTTPTSPSKSTKQQSKTTAKKAQKKPLKSLHRGRHFILAFAASAACVVLLGVIVKVNMPDLSVQVAAMQAGIDAKYPSFIPSGFQLSGVSTDKSGPIRLEFTSSNSTSFTLTEEKSAWDSNALLNNYVKGSWGEDYAVVREQGITIYISNSDAAWVNGGICYKLASQSADALTKQQIKSIVTSL